MIIKGSKKDDTGSFPEWILGVSLLLVRCAKCCARESGRDRHVFPRRHPWIWAPSWHPSHLRVQRRRRQPTTGIAQRASVGVASSMVGGSDAGVIWIVLRPFRWSDGAVVRPNEADEVFFMFRFWVIKTGWPLGCFGLTRWLIRVCGNSSSLLCSAKLAELDILAFIRIARGSKVNYGNPNPLALCMTK